MAEFDYEQWWRLHVRVARGESLSAVENVTYRSGLNHLESSEAPVDQDIMATLQALQKQIEQLSQEHASLMMRSLQLDQKLAALEATYQSMTGQTLPTIQYAPS